MIRIFRRGERPATMGAAERFTGTVRTDMRFAADAPGTASGALVLFDPGARTAWHAHPLGQTLIVMTGVGRVQEWGGPVREIQQGDVVWFPPHVKHWHGAAPDTPMSHLAVAEREGGVSSTWAELVDDAQYRGERVEARSGEMGIRIHRNGSLPSAAGPEATFTGRVRLDQPFSWGAPARIGGAHVTFEPGARTAWHTHPCGQTLIVTSGAGLVQQWGGPVQAIQPGDVVWFPAGVEHWHGAAPKTAMGHIAIAESLDGKAVDWMEKVDDGQYPAVHSVIEPENERTAP